MFNKIKYFILLSNLTISSLCFAQVAINEDDSDGDPSAELDLKSTTKGILFPVMTEAQRDALQSPAAGLLIFNSTDVCHNYYNGTNWMQIDKTTALTPAINPATAGTDIGVGVGIANPDNSAILHVDDVTKGFLLPRIGASDPNPTATTGLIYYDSFGNSINYYNGTDWTTSSISTEGAAAGGASTPEGLLIGVGTIEASAKMEVISSNGKGLLIPRMTDAQRDAIESPADGLTIYNTTDNDIQFQSGNVWYAWTAGSFPLGADSTSAGQSCKDIYDNNSLTVGLDGVYWIDPDGAGANTAYEATCDMTRNGGGWTLVVNTGPKSTSMENTATIGTTPILAGSAGDPGAKLSDADINLIRGALANSIIWFEPQFGNGSETDVFFKENTAYLATSAVDATSIKTYNLVYADAVSATGMVTNAARNNAGALHNWNAPAGSGMIMSWNGEQLITDGGDNDCNSGGTSNRRLCNGLIWVKQP